MGLKSPTYEVTCDQPGCDKRGWPGLTPGEARTRAAEEGFKLEKYPSNGALCPLHKPEEEDK